MKMGPLTKLAHVLCSKLLSILTYKAVTSRLWSFSSLNAYAENIELTAGSVDGLVVTCLKGSVRKRL